MCLDVWTSTISDIRESSAFESLSNRTLYRSVSILTIDRRRHHHHPFATTKRRLSGSLHAHIQPTHHDTLSLPRHIFSTPQVSHLFVSSAHPYRLVLSTSLIPYVRFESPLSTTCPVSTVPLLARCITSSTSTNHSSLSMF